MNVTLFRSRFFINTVKLRSLRWALNPIWHLFLKRRIDTETQEEHCVKTEAETGVMHLQAKEAKDCCQHKKLRERHGTDSSLELSEHGLDDTLTLDSSFQNYERIHFCCFKPTHLWYFVTAALGNQYKPLNQFGENWQLYYVNFFNPWTYYVCLSIYLDLFDSFISFA